ncbi:hypothetical protein K4039_26600 [Lyngbya sp. CCAP 1446/10]|uniref:hypothetical protein n=1 Tax=Lyngbya sp. CCAP 1446/10 TaxID=439293 RepID=UPI00223842E3|nr:hypothetical protein [Lyngbya sp. CCAP 1446/10]MCW6053526.1 hypothetical protein [Lyngbya sp. CCAP 1446/10]
MNESQIPQIPWVPLSREAHKLSVTDRLALVNAIVESIRRELKPPQSLPDNFVEPMTGLPKTDTPPPTNEVKIRFGNDRKGAAKRLRGLAKTDTPPPTDAEVAAMLEERLVEKYLK